ncbi:MAG TPA: serine hydrolase domain-containing protein [Terriglobales bacterium]|jgi:CubicO group peptidase (beta-lactamase class C family)
MSLRPQTLFSTIGILLSLFCLAARSGAQTVGGSLATAKQIQDMLVQRIDVQHKSDGIVVGVITKKAREVISYGHFDRDDPRVPNGDTLFEIGSISKVFTSLLLSEMVLDGEVKLSDPISKYLPASIHAPSRSGKQITLLDLATHHSGLPSMPTNFVAYYSTQQLFEFLDHYQLTRDPGEKYEYSNVGVGLLGDLLALRANTSYQTLLRTRISAPLGMNSTAVALTPEMKANFTPGHHFRLEKADPWIVPALEGAGGIRSTVNDLLIFLAANLGIIHTPLQPAMKQMLSVHRRTATSGSLVALGWHIATDQGGIVLHDGQTYGYYSSIGFDVHRKIGVVILSNSYVPTDDILWRIFSYPLTAPVEEHVGPPGFRP